MKLYYDNRMKRKRRMTNAIILRILKLFHSVQGISITKIWRTAGRSFEDEPSTNACNSFFRTANKS